MKKTFSYRLHETVAFHLMKVVFSIYLLIAITVTVIHMVSEYANTQANISRDLVIFQKTFEPSISHAMWNLDLPMIRDTIYGILQVPIIVGVKITNENGEALHGFEDNIKSREDLSLLNFSAETDDLQQQKSDLFGHDFTIFHDGQPIGKGTFYSSAAVVLERVQYGFIFIVINSLVKTLALWLIFMICARVILSRPLAALTRAAEQLDLEKLEDFQIAVHTKKRNEMKILEEAFLAMIRNLISARESMKSMERVKLELETAQTLQHFLISRSDPQLTSLEVASFYESAAETGGDWYGFEHDPEKNTLDVMIGDVTGHGVPAALVTALTASFCQAMQMQRQVLHGAPAESLRYPAYLLEQLNAYLYQTIGGLYTVTFFYAMLDLAQKEMIYACAAHTPCYVWRPEKFLMPHHEAGERSIMFLKEQGAALGELPGSQYAIHRVPLQKDDVLLWYTDGLTENYNSRKQMWGTRELKHILRTSHEHTAHEIKERIIRTAYQHYGDTPLEDDVTLIVARVR